MKTKITFEDLFDLVDIEKGFEQTLEYDILKQIEKWNIESEKNEQFKKVVIGILLEYFASKPQELIEILKPFMKEILQEEMREMLHGNGIFGEKYFKLLEINGFERNCIGCEMAQRNYAFKC